MTLMRSIRSMTGEPNHRPHCFDIGWVLDCNDLNKTGPRMVEFIPCIYPPCEASGRPIQSVCFKGIEFKSVARHPVTGVVMSVSVGA